MSDDIFEGSRETARDLLTADDLDGLYLAVSRGDEMDFAFGHRHGDPETVGIQALSMLAKHVQVIADESGLPPEKVARDAVELAQQMEEGGEESGDGTGNPE